MEFAEDERGKNWNEEYDYGGMNDFRFELIMMEEGLIYVVCFYFYFFCIFFMNVVENDVEDDEEIERKRWRMIFFFWISLNVGKEMKIQFFLEK